MFSKESLRGRDPEVENGEDGLSILNKQTAHDQ